MKSLIERRIGVQQKNTLKKPVTLNEQLKYEIASELGLLDKIKEYGWKGLTAKETGKIGGMMTRRKKMQ